MPTAGFEPTIPASKLSQTHALVLAATGIGVYNTNVNESVVRAFGPTEKAF